MANPIFYGSTAFGSEGVQLTADDFTIDQRSQTYTRSWSGTESAVNLKADAILVSGGRATVTRAGGMFKVIGTFATDPSAPPEDEIPKDSYSFTTSQKRRWRNTSQKG
jgi:O-acetylhomoserine/O-acetylserine sulfhydrylase-like pyridoxal-dependent enzyme